MSINKVALIGATGNLGPAILSALLDNGFEVTVLSREGSTSTDSLASHPNQTIVKVDFEDTESITSALKGVDGVVSNVASSVILSQKKIIDAAVAAGVKRFLPSDFGSDLGVKGNREMPFNAPKVEIHRYLEEKVKAHPEFSYTSVANGPFLDWCLRMGIFADINEHDVTLWNGGETRVSSTTLASVGKVVVSVFKDLEATKNKTVRVADATVTQKQIIDIAKEIDGKEWTTTVASTDDAYQASMEEMKKSEPNMMVVIMNQLFKMIFDKGNGSDMSGRLDNEMLGLPSMTGEQLKEVIKSCMP